MTQRPHTMLRLIVLALLAVSTLALLAVEALSAPPPVQVPGETMQDQTMHRPPVQQVSDALGERLDHMMLAGKPAHSH